MLVFSIFAQHTCTVLVILQYNMRNIRILFNTVVHIHKIVFEYSFDNSSIFTDDFSEFVILFIEAICLTSRCLTIQNLHEID